MSEDISKEFLFFLKAAITGIGMLAAYDVFRILRKVFVHNVIMIAVEDIVYWICSSLAIFYILLMGNSGIIRWFFVVGIAAGMILYNATLSQYFVKYNAFFLNKILHLVERVLLWVLRPIVFVTKKSKRGVAKCAKTTEKHLKIQKKRLKKVGKAFKMVISRR